MLAGILIAAYLAAALLTWRIHVVKQLEFVAGERLAELRKRYGGPSCRDMDRDAFVARQIQSDGGLVGGSDRSHAVLSGALFGSVWPLFWLWFGLYRMLALSTHGLTATTERTYLAAAAERAELYALRRQAAELGLPMPDVGDDQR